MDLNWLESFLYGLFSGLTDILPVSAEAHRILVLKCFGIQSSTELMKLFAHLGVFGAMYFSCRKQIVRIHRARRLARVPKRRRRRPLDTRSLMDFSLLRTMLIPVILGFFLNRYVEPLKEKLLAAGVQGVTIYQVHGCGNQHGWIAYHRGNEVMMNTLPKVYLMTVVPDDRVEDFLQLIKENVYTGTVGDGKIFISTVDECIRIRTNETGDAAL